MTPLAQMPDMDLLNLVFLLLYFSLALVHFFFALLLSPFSALGKEMCNSDIAFGSNSYFLWRLTDETCLQPVESLCLDFRSIEIVNIMGAHEDRHEPFAGQRWNAMIYGVVFGCEVDKGCICW